ncbi:MAG: DUF1566 domain-containing protein [Campylobacteraceae bacterium]|nr:DUF1566 domain-containing protein [Campylobacteraceae bacterium]
MKKILLLVLTLISFSFAAVLQECKDTLTKTAPNVRFVNDDINGTSKDLQTGLIWNRCVMGKKWNKDKKTCEGENTAFNWASTLTNIQDYNMSDENNTGITKWRLPNIKELYSLAENACVKPALNITVFPNFLSKNEYGVENYLVSSTYLEASSEVMLFFPYSNSTGTYSVAENLGALLVSDEIK